MGCGGSKADTGAHATEAPVRGDRDSDSPDGFSISGDDAYMRDEEAAKKIQKIFRAASYKMEAKKRQTWQVTNSQRQFPH